MKARKYRNKNSVSKKMKLSQSVQQVLLGMALYEFSGRRVSLGIRGSI